MIEISITLSFFDMNNCIQTEADQEIASENFSIEKCSFSFFCDELTTVKELYEYAVSVLYGIDDEFIINNVIHKQNTMLTFSLENRSEKVSKTIEDSSAKFLNELRSLNLDTEINLVYSLGGYGAPWEEDDGVKYFTNSNEENHKYMPHIHTRYKKEKARYLINTGEKLDGVNYPRKVEQRITNKILSNRDKLLAFWRDTTNGEIPSNIPFNIDEIENNKNQ